MKITKHKKSVAMFLSATLALTSLPYSAVLAANYKTSDKIWDFSDGTQGWNYDGSWVDKDYKGSCEYDENKKMLKVNLDYSEYGDKDYIQPGISIDTKGVDFSLYKVLNFDLYYDPSKLTGDIAIKFADIIGGEKSIKDSSLVSSDVDGLKKVSMSFEVDKPNAKPDKLHIVIAGKSTTYKGDIWFDNIKLSATKPREEGLKDTTVKPETRTNITSTADAVTVNGNSTNYATSVKLVDSMADNKTISLYQYLKAIGESDSTLFGHMEDTVLKAGSADLSYSDTEDATGSISAIVGLDCGELFRGFASKYNNRHEGSNLPDTNKGNIKAAALFSNEAIANGAIITISAHMPNFAFSEAQEGENTYDKFNFFAENSYNLKGDCINNILPGGKYNDRFNAYLDMVAEYASQVDGAILFRPFHENTGSWFWWGKAFCDTETYKSVFKYTVEYLRDTKDIHNLIYVYGPGSEANSLAEYEERYPGDEYVDMVGFDTYDNSPAPTGETSVFEQNFETITRLVDEFAKKHGKLFAVTETGMSSEANGGIPKTGNKRPEWYSEILDIVTKPDYNCCYFMLWSNYSKDGGYYTPFVEEVNEDGTFFGHELLDAFITFYNNEKSIFAKDQLSTMNLVNSGRLVNATNEVSENVNGYITTPIAGSRILEETTLKANLSVSDVKNVTFKILGNQEVSLNATVSGKQATAILDKDNLAKMGEVADGKIILYAGDKKLQEISVIFNIESRPDNPLLVDDFEVYGGVDALLGASWAKNNDTGNTLNISLSQDFKYDGTYSMKFDYNETSTGWAGCTIPKEADWSNCNAVQFYVKPDGNNQKTVIQINTSDGGSYEAYLQNYSEYANTTKPLLVTLPFNEFVDKGGRGALTSVNAKSITGFGLWLNAISDSPAIKDGRVSGTLYYDAIQAVSTQNTQPVFQTLGGSEELSVEDKELKEAINNANAVIDNPNSKVDDLLKAIANLSTAIIKHNK